MRNGGALWGVQCTHALGQHWLLRPANPPRECKAVKQPCCPVSLLSVSALQCRGATDQFTFEHDPARRPSDNEPLPATNPAVACLASPPEVKLELLLPDGVIGSEGEVTTGLASLQKSPFLWAYHAGETSQAACAGMRD